MVLAGLEHRQRDLVRGAVFTIVTATRNVLLVARLPLADQQAPVSVRRDVQTGPLEVACRSQAEPSG